MWGNLFDLIDGLFKGVVGFFYNFGETLMAILRRPLRGPPILQRAHMSRDRRQIAGVTMLFLSYFAAFPLVVAVLEGAFSASAAAEKLAELPNPLSAPWSLLAAALTSTIVIDLVLAAVLLLLYRRRRSRRVRLRSTISYALVVPVVLTTLFAILAYPTWMYARYGGLDLLGVQDWLLALLGPIAVFAASVPAALLLIRERTCSATGARARARTEPLHRAIRRRGVAGHAVLLGLLVTTATIAGASVGIEIYLRENLRSNKVIAERLECRLAGGRLVVEGVVRNSTGRPLVLGSDDFGVWIGPFERSDGDGSWYAASQDPPLLLEPAEPGEPDKLVDQAGLFLVRGSAPLPPRMDRKCMLSLQSGDDMYAEPEFIR